MNGISKKTCRSSIYLLTVIYLLCSSACNSEKKKNELIDTGNSFMAKRDYYSAYQYYMKARQYDSTDSRINANLGAVSYVINSYDAAIYYLNIANRHDSSSKIYLFRGLSYLYSNRANNAIADLSHVLKTDRTNIRALQGIAGAELAIDSFYKTEFYLRKMIELDRIGKVNSKVEMAAVYQSLGAVLSKTNRLDSGLLYLKLAIETDSQMVYLYVTRAAILQDAGRFKEALNDFKKIRELDPKRGKTYKELAMLYLASKQYDKICGALDTARMMGVQNIEKGLSKYCK